jgi:hypothetical protein
MPDPVNLNDIYKAIGGLTSEVTSLRRDLQEAESAAVASTRRADEHRSVMHKRLDEIVTRTVALENKQETVNTKIVGIGESLAEVKEVTDKVTMWEQRGLGALFVTGLGASAVTFAVTHWIDQIVTFFRGT